ncbi:MAG: GNAT family N-acetyltransferase, partial [Gemmatimonadetes bacterium]|nr:GNAT family N-acetyltransferase [Gemmatimonadota bacterium]
PSELDRYPEGLEEQKEFGDEQFIVRPIRSDDADRLMRFFYTHDTETVYGRYRFPKQSMPREEAVRLCTMDYKTRFAIGVFRDAGKNIELVAIGRYEGDETSKVAEPAFVVHEKFRRRGMANYLYERLRARAASCGLTSFEGSFSIENRASIELHRRRGNDVYYSDGLYWYQDSLEKLESPETLELGETSTSLST